MEAESLEELADALNALGVRPERLVRLLPRAGEPDAEDEITITGWVALTWVE